LSSTRNRFLVAAAIFCCSHAHGALPDEIQVYTDDVNAPGERGIELHVNTTPSGRSAPGYPGEVPTHHGLRITPELSWGLAPDVDWGLYLPFVRSGDGTDYFAGPRFRLKWMPLRGNPGYFAGVNGELSFVERKFEEARRTAEFRPIVGYRNDDWLLSFNPIVGTDLAGPQKGVLTFAPAFKIARSAGGGYALGAEYYAELGRLSHFAPGSEQSHILYFVLDTQKLNFGVGRGLNGATDRWTVKAIYSF
jgi:hypothetical protein